VVGALRKGGADKEYIDKFKNEATSGDYDNLLQTVCKYVDEGYDYDYDDYDEY
jgi:hypothetical protein